MCERYFPEDDGKNPELSKLCRNYIEKFSDFSSHKWLVLYGACGTGKTYAAKMIANRLQQRYDSVYRYKMEIYEKKIRITYFDPSEVIDKPELDSILLYTFPEIEQKLWNNAHKDKFYDELFSCPLLILDDFGMERKTDYMNEIKFNVIDGRLRADKPCIITTNLSKQDFVNQSNIQDKRIFSRIFEKSMFYEVKGNDRRFEKLKENSKSGIEHLLSD